MSDRIRVIRGSGERLRYVFERPRQTELHERRPPAEACVFKVQEENRKNNLTQDTVDYLTGENLLEIFRQHGFSELVWYTTHASFVPVTSLNDEGFHVYNYSLPNPPPPNAQSEFSSIAVSFNLYGAA